MKAIKIGKGILDKIKNSLIDVLPNTNSLPADCTTNDESVHIEIDRALNTLEFNL